LVTDVTSLVVVKPDQEPKVTQLNNLRQTDYPDYGYNYASYAYAAPASYAAPALTGFSSAAAPPPPPPPPPSFVQTLGNSVANFASSIGNTIGTVLRSSASVQRKRPQRPRPRPRPSLSRTTTTTTMIFTTTLRPSLPSQAPAGDCYGDGELTLYSKTYHRGDQLELTSSQPDLADQQFDQRAVSALVTGSCCWELYSGTNYSGDQITLRPGQQYTGVTSLGDLFRNVASVRRVQC